MDSNLGATEFFQGAMANTVAKNTKKIKMLANSTFAAGGLVMMFQAAPAAPDALAQPSSITSFPALAEIENVKSFKLLTGSIQVIYYA
jgi:hypothetical protein